MQTNRRRSKTVIVPRPGRSAPTAARTGAALARKHAEIEIAGHVPKWNKWV